MIQLEITQRKESGNYMPLSSNVYIGCFSHIILIANPNVGISESSGFSAVVAQTAKYLLPHAHVQGVSNRLLLLLSTQKLPDLEI